MSRSERMKKFFCNISKGFERYLDWITELPDILSVIVIFINITVLAVVLISSAFYAVDTKKEKHCLDSLKPRRFRNLTCEEYIDSNWIEINPYKENVTYKYNEPASRIKE